MVPRYSRPQMAAIWSPEERFRIWFEIEALAAEAMAELGTIPAEAARVIRTRARRVPPPRRRGGRGDRRHRARHPARRHRLPHLHGGGHRPEARFMHQGMTSSDVLDTCFAVQLTRAADLLIADVDALLAALKTRAFEHQFTPTIGRSHGIQAEPTTFGLKLAGYYAEFPRNRARLVTARAEIATCAISGPVGTFASVDPRVEEFVAAKLGLSVEPVSTQVIQRDRHAAFFGALAVVGASIERLATEFRHLQRTEVLEAEESFHHGPEGQQRHAAQAQSHHVGTLTGLARLVRGNAVAALENVALWHERDISHSSVERVIAPDATIGLDFALSRLTGMMEKLTVYPARMAQNLESLGGVVHSQKVLLALTQAGMSREDAYAAVQSAAMATWRALGTPEVRSFRDNLLDEPGVTLDAAALDAAMDPQRDFTHVSTIFRRVFAGA